MIKKAKNRRRILIVDDDPSITEMLSMLLETRGYAVDVVHSGEEALECIPASTDLILLDLILPDIEGFEVCRRIKQNEDTRHIPIIMLTGKILPNDLIEGLYLGADDYLTKPFEYEELIARMEVAMRRASIMQENIAGREKVVVSEVRKIIEEEMVVSFFQPIYLLKPLKLFGVEALCRPQTSSMLSNPDLLFKAAIQCGFYQELEMLSWTKALEAITKHLDTEKLFLNCNPYLIEGPKFLTIKSLFDKSNIRVENVILEITERSAITDFKKFYNHLKQYRDYGFKFAVDDVGGGYASLESIIETKPEVVKIDRHIISGIHADSYRRSLIKFVVAFCKENNILSVAEGIETKLKNGYHCHYSPNCLDLNPL